MPFLRAGFNYRHHDTGIRGWTQPLNGRRPFAPAALIEFTPKAIHTSDFAWVHHADRPRFIAWGETCIFGSWGITLPWEAQNGLAHSILDTREEVPAWKWADERRAAMGLV